MFRLARLSKRLPVSISCLHGSATKAQVLRRDRSSQNIHTTASCRQFSSSRPSWLGHATPSGLAKDDHSESQGRAIAEGPVSMMLPTVCPGCGAMGQTVEPDIPGFYDPTAKRNKRTMKSKQNEEEDKVFADAMSRLSEVSDGSQLANSASPQSTQMESDVPASLERPICDRCHYLRYQSKGDPIAHPSMQSIQSIIEASPYKNNHIYHVLDAADFPMSLIPNLINALRLPRLRTQNRRSKTIQYIRGRLAEVSFIITRSDLLAPQKEQVDRLMPYLQDVLRDALGRTAQNVRLGNVRLVSAKRGWWTPNVKQEIWRRGGAGWFVGKVNVGKSALFEVVFPKGRGEAKALETPGMTTVALGQQDGRSRDALDELDNGSGMSSSNADGSEMASPHESAQVLTETEATLEDDDLFDEDVNASLLPPAQPETLYPQMPTVSSLPGTTASPIRIPYGHGKGELIDLPGVERSLLETHVQPEHRSSLVMESRVVPLQEPINAGQSLLLGGLIRITPLTEDLQFLSYSFTALDSHVTRTSKAVAVQTGVNEDGTPYEGPTKNIATDEAKVRMRSAGKFELKWDVTKQRTGALTDKAAGKQKASNLPFIVYGADILIEGVGWVELTCQVRRYPRREQYDWASVQSSDVEEPSANSKPMVEVFTPTGKFIGVRKPMNAWVLGGPKKLPKHAQRSRPRMTISMKRRQEGGARGRPLNDT